MEPTKSRYKIICEEKAFPSDQYMFPKSVNFHGYKIREMQLLKLREERRT
jgi:kynureninase